MGDVSNSYKGEPTVNLLSNVDDWSSGWTGNLFGNWVNATVTANAGVAPDGTTTASKLTGGYSRWQRINCSTSTTYTFSFWIKNIDLPIAPQIHIAFGLNGSLVNYNNVTTIALDTIGEWTRVSKTHTSPSSGINQMEVGVTWSSNYPNTNSVLVWHAMCEQNAHLTPFTAGTRSATEGLKDLTGNSTIDLTNASFDSDAQMTFDGSSDHIDLGTALNSYGSVSIELVFKTSTSSDMEMLLSWGTPNSSNYSGIGIGNWAGGIPDESLGVVSNGQTLQMWVKNGHTAYKDDNYHHAIVTLHPGQNRVFVDGIEQTMYYQYGSINTDAGAFTISNNQVSIGKYVYNNGSRLNGKLPLIKIYNRALTASEVKSNFNAIKGRFNI